MTYLDSSKIIFTGDFLADVSTVNNDVRHYDNKTFEKRFQEPRDGAVQNGWWNPAGGALFRFIDCTIKRCVDAKGNDDYGNPIIGLPITNADDRSGGKMVDLDPQMQMTSEVWGVRVRLVGPNNELYVEGKILHTGFRDLQVRQYDAQLNPSGAPNGQPLGASFCSVLEEVQWGSAADGNPFLKALKEETDNDQLSIYFTTFGYYYSHADGRFSMGRVVGTISPRNRTEPLKFAPTRRVYGAYQSFFQFTNYDINKKTRVLSIDLGMSIPLTGSMGAVNPAFTKLTIAVINDIKVIIPIGGQLDSRTNQPKKTTIPADYYQVIGEVTISNPSEWLTATGGVVNFELDKNLLEALENQQLLILKEEQGQQTIYARESSDGWYLRADQNVQRIDPGDTVEVDLYAYQWGKTMTGKQISIAKTKAIPGGGSQPEGVGEPTAPVPNVNEPAGKIKLSDIPKTNRYGRTEVKLTGEDAGNPRGYIDGQIYFYGYKIDGVASLDQYQYDDIIIHLRDAFEVPKAPKWKDVKETWIQFGNLYPIMSHHIMDFSLPKEILRHKSILLFAFTREIDDPLYMPVTRDLSKNKMATLIKWLELADPNTVEEEEEAEEIIEQSDGQEVVKPALNATPSVLALYTKAKAGDLEAIGMLSNLSKDS